MQFGLVPISEASGGILAHSHRAEGLVFRKGRVLSEKDSEALRRAGVENITVARLEADDIAEDEAAKRIARCCASPEIRVGAAFTGRANLYAQANGLALIDTEIVFAINAVDESITIATLPPFAQVSDRQMLATIKIIPFAAPRAKIEAVERIAAERQVVGVAPFQSKRVALISTALADTRPQLLDKSADAISRRLHSMGSELAFERRVAHAEDAVASAIADAREAGADPILVFGASAITDRRDVIPAAIVRAGGNVEHFGMPVDPGNLLLLGDLRGTTVIGLPGCARSPKRNGFDFVLERVLAGLDLGSSDITEMGVGGLLTEIASRPQPRDDTERSMSHAPAIAALVLAAGLGSRMGRNKMLETIAGKPVLRHCVEAALASQADDVTVVIGHDSDRVKSALADLPVKFVANENYRDGLSTSLKAGIGAVPEISHGAIVLLGDMPGVTAALIDKLIAAFNPAEGRSICVASHASKRGNPVLWAKQYFPGILALEGDIGAKHLIAENEDAVCEVEANDDAPLIDIDTPDDLSAWIARAQ